MATNARTRISYRRYRDPKTGKIVRVRTKTIDKTKSTGGKTAEERMINSLKPEDRPAAIKQYQKNRAVMAGTASAEATGTAMTATLGNKNTNIQSQVSSNSNSNLTQNIDGGISKSTNTRDDDEVDEGFDHPGIN